MHFFKGFTLSLHMKRGKFCWFFITTDEEKFCSVMDILQVNPCRDYLLSLEKVTGAEISPTLPYRVTTWLEKVNISRLHNIEFYVQPSNYVNSLHFIKWNIIRWSNVSQHPKVIAFLQEKIIILQYSGQCSLSFSARPVSFQGPVYFNLY